MKNIKLQYLVFLWLATTLIATYLKITHTAQLFSEILFAFTFFNLLLIFIKIYYIIIKKKA